MNCSNNPVIRRWIILYKQARRNWGCVLALDYKRYSAHMIYRINDIFQASQLYDSFHEPFVLQKKHKPNLEDNKWFIKIM